MNRENKSTNNERTDLKTFNEVSINKTIITEIKLSDYIKQCAAHSTVNGHEFELAPGVSDGKGSLVCCGPWVTKSWT